MKFPLKLGFAKCIKKHLKSGSVKVKAQHWACVKKETRKFWKALSY